jgi:colicin import membrane protein
MSELQVILKEQGVATENAKQLLEAFGAPFEEAGEILQDYQTIKVESEDDTDAMAEARAKRLALKKVRTTVENKRKELKSDIVKAGKAIDSVAKFVKEVITPAEDYLQLQEDFVKIKQQKELDERRAARLFELGGLVEDPSVYNIDALDDEQYVELVERLTQEKSDREAAAKLAEEVRLKEEAAEKARQAEITAENERLKAEAVKREAEQAAANAKANAEQDRLKAEAQKAAQEKQALEAEIARRAEEERKAVEEAAAAEKAKAAAPDRDKLLAYAQALQDVAKPTLSSTEAVEIMTTATQFLVQLTHKISDKARSL